MTSTDRSGSRRSAPRRTPPPLPAGLDATDAALLANRLHTVAIHLLRRAAMADRESGLTPERLSLLSVLVFGGPQPVHAVARAEGLSLAAVSRSLGALEELGLARRERGTRDDKRMVIASATDEGAALMQRGRLGRLRLLTELVEGLSPTELRTVARALDPIERLLAP